MKLAITCTTYERPNQLLALMKQVLEQLDYFGYEAAILVLNDGSIRSYRKTEELLSGSRHEADYVRLSYNMKKQGHWFLMDMAFKWVEKQDFDYVIHLQDDLILSKDFLYEAVRHFEAINDRWKVCLNYVLEESRNGVQCWTPAKARIHRYRGIRFYKVGWVELHYIANRDFFDCLDYTVYRVDPGRWNRDPALSSGVGRQISWRVYNRFRSMYQVTESLAVHGMYPSKMNPEERAKNPLRSI